MTRCFLFLFTNAHTTFFHIFSAHSSIKQNNEGGMHGTNPNDVNGGRKRRMDWDPLDLNSNGNIGSTDPKIPNLAACGKDQRRKDNIIANGNGTANANGGGSGKQI